mgnify:CR=1 FL=1
MNQPVLTFPAVEADYRQWDYVHSTWRVDIERWRREHESALAQLAKLQEIIRLHGDALNSHAEAVERHHQSLQDNARAMSEYQSQGGGEGVQQRMASHHNELAEQHEAQRDAHERIKKYHHTVMAHLATMKTAIDAAM